MARDTRLHGRAFYESLGSPKYIVAPMVDQSEFAWRLLTRSFLPADLRTSILAYSPMLHAKLFAEGPKYRASHFEPLKPPFSLAQPGDVQQQKTSSAEDAYLDGNPQNDRPLFVQFCANDAEHFLEAAKIVQPYCDAVDLNLGCPQGIARRGNYGSFLQEDWDTIHRLISTLHEKLDVPVTAKMRVLETKEKTLEYAKMILNAGASIITVHGRQRDQKGHKTGLADWSVLRYLREQLPPDTVIFANGNILQHEDIQQCLDETKADGVMSAEGNLYDPSIFATGPPVGEEGREYWRGRDGKGGYRVDAVLRRYLDIIHTHVMRQEPPKREPLFIPSDASQASRKQDSNGHLSDDGQPPAKKQKIDQPKEKTEEGKPKNGKHEKVTNANLVAMQAHCFHILRPLVSKHHNVRDALARSRAGDIAAYENVLTLTEKAVKEGLLAYESDPAQFEFDDTPPSAEQLAASESSDAAVRRCKRPYWVCQPYVRPLPKEALEKGSLQLSKKELAKMAKAEEEAKKAGVEPNGKVEKVANGSHDQAEEVPKAGLVCG
ncbi:putative dihydrouridine synthase family protein [Neohortaea acidophila]|uniref:tRNA-dihydrouridine(16/17) synthase [NAD(P)(+)] n=1 Tax=Neohortaea acidophila TaxID=245834 RepID=A0A6A6PLZ1_9PEZI|nr:putative dihydrouridine synthase family protein [Neohortaea acidophila]KAF2480925.1 putative dihydrouridine synthase family protein [Neohortaea acidophila]